MVSPSNVTIAPLSPITSVPVSPAIVGRVVLTARSRANVALPALLICNAVSVLFVTLKSIVPASVRNSRLLPIAPSRIVSDVELSSNSIRASARGMDKLVALQLKINKGENVSVNIQKEIRKILKIILNHHNKNPEISGFEVLGF